MKLIKENNKEEAISNSDDRSENFIIDFWLSSLLSYLFILLFDKGILISILLYYLVRFSYYFLFDFFYLRTPGKFETQNKVVNEKGGKPSFFQLMIRNLSRFFSLVSFVSDSEKTIHDEVSKTLVIKNIKLKKIEFKRMSIFLFYLLSFCYWVYILLIL
ncbi:hypothetical protein DS884_01010 [Tenacibaculum sp. E3R01]|uniref:RDD family protein n=1 Tax=Tenacibaculum sp. E3R01 TaxID=2267227 RepID=UPI000DEB7F1E|nr:RDD family protein [Tenacibaculum sp. E3R01]RBW62924.1 hypothetical protein DS884_01010 [Tenacibaculum sp. E3R01]